MKEGVRPPLPPFSYEDALVKVRRAEDAWNGKSPEAIVLAYSLDSIWRNRNQFLKGRAEIIEFLTNKWLKELDYRLIKEMWAFGEDKIAVRFAYEWHDDRGCWYRSYGNENWEFDELGLMKTRYASINDMPISESDRKFCWEGSARPADYPGLTALGC